MSMINLKLGTTFKFKDGLNVFLINKDYTIFKLNENDYKTAIYYMFLGGVYHKSKESSLTLGSADKDGEPKLNSKSDKDDDDEKEAIESDEPSRTQDTLNTMETITNSVSTLFDPSTFRAASFLGSTWGYLIILVLLLVESVVLLWLKDKFGCNERFEKGIGDLQAKI